MRKSTLAAKIYYEEPLSAHASARKRERNGWVQIARLGAYCIVTVTFLVLGYLGLCTRIVEEQYALDQYDSILPALREENANLEIQVKALGRLSRIDAIARNQLHMAYPTERLIIEEEPAAAAAPGRYYAWRLGKRIAIP